MVMMMMMEAMFDVWFFFFFLVTLSDSNDVMNDGLVDGIGKRWVQGLGIFLFLFLEACVCASDGW